MHDNGRYVNPRIEATRLPVPPHLALSAQAVDVYPWPWRDSVHAAGATAPQAPSRSLRAEN
jgi:hypothetical protein